MELFPRELSSRRVQQDYSEIQSFIKAKPKLQIIPRKVKNKGEIPELNDETKFNQFKKVRNISHQI